MENKKLEIGQIIEMKKEHPCGSKEWKIWRTGIDIGMECLGCGRRIMVPRKKVEKGIKRIVSEPAEQENKSS